MLHRIRVCGATAYKTATIIFALALSLCVAQPAVSQGTTATLNGVIVDSSDAVIPQASIILENTATGATRKATSSGSGEFVLPSLEPGPYALRVQKHGFAESEVTGIVLHVTDNISINVKLKVGSAGETVSVNASSELNTTDGTVSTVMGHELIENMPLNGKDLTTLFELSPGTILNAGSGGPADGAGFSVDGQRATSNYLTIDGASGEAYISPAPLSSNLTGASIATSASGGTNGILPIDAIEEYRMDTSTYTAANGRTPGGQIQVRTRSGTNQFHGTLFEDFRNQVLDDTDWFVKYNNLQQSPLRMNDFGGTLGGPVTIPHFFDGRNKLFFFVAHDTLLLDQPTTANQLDVPASSDSISAYPTFAAFLTAFPAGNGGPIPGYAGFDFFNASFPYQIRDHTTSVRIDVQLPHSMHAFFRANIAPSTSSLPGIADDYGGITTSINIYTYTAGFTVQLGKTLVNETTINKTSVEDLTRELISKIGDNNPNAISGNLPTGITLDSDQFVYTLDDPTISIGANVSAGADEVNQLHQWNVVDDLSWQLGKHSIKFGGDYLLRHPQVSEPRSNIDVIDLLSSSPPNADLDTGVVDYLLAQYENASPKISLTDFSLFANDDWHFSKSLTFNAGLRWEYNPPPSVGPLGTLALEGNNLSPATIEAEVSNKPLYNTRYDNFAPRFGFSWSPFGSQSSKTVVRGGVGIYFDTGQAATVSQAAAQTYPYLYDYDVFSPVPYTSIDFSGIPASATRTPLPESSVNLVAPNLQSPRTYQWSLTVDHNFGKHTLLSTSYVANDGEQLMESLDYYNTENSAGVYTVNPNLVSSGGYLYILTNQSHSNYQSLQEQFTSRVGKTLNILASYTWAHAEDNGSSDFSSVGAGTPNPMANSAFDIRNLFGAAVHYAPSGIVKNHLSRALTSGWALDSIARLQSAEPFTVTVPQPPGSQFLANADALPGVPTILHQKYNSTTGELIPGGILLNHAAFAAPPESSSGDPLEQGNSPTNGYRLFSLKQWDVALSRTWKIVDLLDLSFRIDAFNLINVPNFSDPYNTWSAMNSSQFGEAQNTYAGGYGAQPASFGNSGSQLAVFQNGGPREVQLSLKLKF